MLLQAGCQEGGRVMAGLSTPCGTPSADNVALPPQMEVWSIAPDQHWVIYTETPYDPKVTWGRHYWLAKLDCQRTVDPVMFLGPTTDLDYLLGFSSDSSAVLFVTWTEATSNQLWTVPLPDVQDKREIYAGFMRSLAWAPDRRHVVIVPNDQGADLVGADSSVRRIIPEGTFRRKGGGVISWSPPGDQVAYIEDGDWEKAEPCRLWVSDIQSGQRRQVYTTPGRSVANPDWSPDGGTIAVYDPTTSDDPVVLVSPSGTVRASVQLPSAVESEKWSPDGKQLAVMYPVRTGDDRKYYLGVITVATGHVAEILLDSSWGIERWTSGEISSWTPDSREVVMAVSQIKGGVSVDELVHIPVK